jgi:aspartate-semialdehyde dehydrogenase
MASTTFSGPVTSTNGFIGALTGNVTGNITGNITGDVVATVQSLSGAGAVNITDMMTSLTTTGASQALTLANGTVGQIKIITHTVDGGSAVLTPTTKIGFSTVTFTAVGDSVSLIYSSAGWVIFGDKGVTIA